jgi:hypothetical protein
MVSKAILGLFQKFPTAWARVEIGHNQSRTETAGPSVTICFSFGKIVHGVPVKVNETLRKLLTQMAEFDVLKGQAYREECQQYDS